MKEDVPTMDTLTHQPFWKHSGRQLQKQEPNFITQTRLQITKDYQDKSK